MPDPNTEHGLRVQLAAALREAEELRDAANTWLAERDALRAEVQRLREALGRCVTIVDAAGLLNLSNGVQLGPTSWYVKATDAFDAARAALPKEPPAP